MSSLTLKDIPEDLLRLLRAAAERDRRSLTQEILHLLEEAVRARESPERAARAQVAAWRKLSGRWKSDVDEATEIERVVGKRSAGRRVEL